MEIKIKKLKDKAILPKKAYSTDACFDIYACLDKEITIFTENTVKIPTGFATEIPEGYYCEVYPRSGLATNHGLRLANSVGIIDADYRGEWIVALHSDSDHPQVIKHGDRIAQFAVKQVLPCELVETDKLSYSPRGIGGFGSTGKN